MKVMNTHHTPKANPETNTVLSAALRERYCIVRTGATVEEYREFEHSSQTRHEYHNGDIIAMPGNTSFHEHLIFTIMVALGKYLAAPEHWVFGSNLKVMIPNYNRFVYPDITVVHGECVFYDAEHRELLNPTLILEVLSPSTADYDLTQKFEYYRSLASLEEIAFFAQDRPHVEHFRRNTSSGKWEVVEVQNATVELRSVQATVSFADVYTMF
jgi:Uma2 family endonuclease